MKLFGKLGLLAATLVFLAACGDLSQEPGARLETLITHGTPDNGEHPHVGILYFKRSDGLYSRCTGTLMSKTVILTAGHCVFDKVEAYASFEERPNDDRRAGEGIAAYLARKVTKGTYHKASAVIPHPRYADFSEFPNTFDVGVVLLETPVTSSKFGVLPELGLLERLSTGQERKDRRFTAVGYGLQGAIPPLESADIARYRGETSLIEINSTRNGDDHSATFTNNPGNGNGSGGTCNGDSGGPIFRGDSNVVGAVTSFGYTPCIGVDYNFRMDTSIAQDFVRPYLKQ